MLDADLAALYGVTTKRVNEQVRRNLGRLPSDFMFQLINHEVAILRSQFATLKTGHGQHRKYVPLAFTAKLLFVPAKFRPMLPVYIFFVEGIEPRADLHVRFQLISLSQA